jgi:hypothetical protein
MFSLNLAKMKAPGIDGILRWIEAYEMFEVDLRGTRFAGSRFHMQQEEISLFFRRQLSTNSTFCVSTHH